MAFSGDGQPRWPGIVMTSRLCRWPGPLLLARSWSVFFPHLYAKFRWEIQENLLEFQMSEKYFNCVKIVYLNYIIFIISYLCWNLYKILHNPPPFRISMKLRPTKAPKCDPFLRGAKWHRGGLWEFDRPPKRDLYTWHPRWRRGTNYAACQRETLQVAKDTKTRPEFCFLRWFFLCWSAVNSLNNVMFRHRTGASA